MASRSRALVWLAPAVIFAVAAAISLQAAAVFEKGARAEEAECRAAGKKGMQCMMSGYEHRLASEGFFWVGFCLALVAVATPGLAWWRGRPAPRPAPLRTASGPSGTR